MINLKFTKASNILIITFIFIGFLFFLFLAICTFISDMNTTRVIIDYEAKARAEENYNSNLFNTQISSKIKYTNFFNLDKSISTIEDLSSKNNKREYIEGDMIGYISIPSINLLLPIYEGTSEAVIQKGVGHLRTNSDEKTFTPICGKNKHCVLTSHSGLSTARLFTDLEKLKTDDVFYLKSEDKFYEYKIMQINIEKPNNVKKVLTVQKDKDYCSLITCTPIGLNTERLIVTGERIRLDKKINTHSVKERKEKQNNICTWICTSFIIMLFFVSYLVKRKRYLL